MFWILVSSVLLKISKLISRRKRWNFQFIIKIVVIWTYVMLLTCVRSWKANMKLLKLMLMLPTAIRKHLQRVSFQLLILVTSMLVKFEWLLDADFPLVCPSIIQLWYDFDWWETELASNVISCAFVLRDCHDSCMPNYEVVFWPFIFAEAISCLEQAVNMFCDIGRLSMAARYYKVLCDSCLIVVLNSLMISCINCYIV